MAGRPFPFLLGIAPGSSLHRINRRALALWILGACLACFSVVPPRCLIAPHCAEVAPILTWSASLRYGLAPIRGAGSPVPRLLGARMIFLRCQDIEPY